MKSEQGFIPHFVCIYLFIFKFFTQTSQSSEYYFFFFEIFLGDVAVTAKGVLSSYLKDSETYYNLDVLDVDLVIKKAYMHVSKVTNNRIIGRVLQNTKLY